MDDDIDLDPKNLRVGQKGWLPTKSIKPSQPHDGREVLMHKPISVDTGGNT